MFASSLFSLALWCVEILIGGYFGAALLGLIWSRCFLRDCDLSLAIRTEVAEYWRGKVVWITGSTSGIGKSLAILLAQRGAYVILSGRRKDALESVAEECKAAKLAATRKPVNERRHSSRQAERESKLHRRRPVGISPPTLKDNATSTTSTPSKNDSRSLYQQTPPNANNSSTKLSDKTPDNFSGGCLTEQLEDVLILQLDITDFERIRACVPLAVGWRGRVDVLINNAGISQRSLFPPFSVDEQMLQTDLMAHIFITKALLPHMLSRNSGQIINTGSAQSRIALPGRVAYCAAKQGLLAYFTALQLELYAINSNIKITTTLPGYVKSELSSNALLSSTRKVDTSIHSPKSDEKSPSKNDSKNDEFDCACNGSLQPRYRRAMEPDRCALLTLRAASRNFQEVWIAKQPELFYLYLNYYFPNSWRWLTWWNAASLLKKNSPPAQSQSNAERRRKRSSSGASSHDSQQLMRDIAESWGFH